MFSLLLAKFSQIISIEQHFLSSFMPTRISKVHVSWWAKSKFQRLSTHIIQELLLSILKQTQETILFEVRSSPCSHQPVIENCLFQCDVKQPVKLTSWIIFFAPTLCKRNSIFCRWNKSTRNFLPHFRSHRERFLPFQCSLMQSTCGKSNKSANLQTHSGLEGILSNYFSVQEAGLQVWTTLLLFNYCKHSLPTSHTHTHKCKYWTNCEAPTAYPIYIFEIIASHE